MIKDYTQIGLTPSRSNLNDEEVKLPLKLLWRAQALVPFVCTPLIAGDTVYVDSTSYAKKGKSESKLFAFNAMTGEKKWEYLYEGGGGAGNYCLHEGLVLSIDKAALVIIKEGKKVLRVEALGGGYPIFYKGVIFFSQARGVRYADPSTWALVKRLYEEAAMDVACYEDKVVFGSYEGNSGVKLHCYNFETGDRIWEKDIRKIGEYLGPDLSNTAVGPSEKVHPGAIDSRFPLIADNKIFVCLNWYVCCFDLETGELIWKSDCSRKKGRSIREVVYKDGKLYGYDVQHFYCFDAETGEIIYKTGGAKRTGAGFGEIPFVSGETFFTTSDGIYAFDLKTGNLVWEYYSKRYVPFAAQAVFINGRLYVGCADGYLYCFESAGG